MRIISIIAIAILTVVVGCNHTRASRQERQRQDARERPFSWQDESILLSDRTTPELSALANESGASEAERAVAVFGLWAKHIRPVCASAVFRGVLSNTNWLRDCPLHKVRLCSGWIPVDMASGDSVFALTLFPSPSDNGATLWTIYFRLTGNVEEGDARAFLTGAAPALLPQ